MAKGDMVQIASVRFGSPALRAGWEQGWDVEEILVPNSARPSEFWVYIPAFAILLLVWMMQGRRARRDSSGTPVQAAA